MRSLLLRNIRSRYLSLPHTTFNIYRGTKLCRNYQITVEERLQRRRKLTPTSLSSSYSTMSSQQQQAEIDTQAQTHVAHDSHGRQIHVTSYQPDWTRSDEYHNSFVLKSDESLDKALEHQRSSGLPDIAVSEAHGKLLYLLARSIGAKRALEVGTLGGYSTIWLAKALPEDGLVITHDISEKHAEVARQSIRNAGQANKVKVIVGEATKTLPNLPSSSPSELFDIAFIDADKPNNVNYFQQAERLVRPGGVIIVDNVVRHGRVADPNIKDGDDNNVDGVRGLLKYIAESKTVEATTIATVGNKGFDGFLYAYKH